MNNWYSSRDQRQKSFTWKPPHSVQGWSENERFTMERKRVSHEGFSSGTASDCICLAGTQKSLTFQPPHTHGSERSSVSGLGLRDCYSRLVYEKQLYVEKGETLGKGIREVALRNKDQVHAAKFPCLHAGVNPQKFACFLWIITQNEYYVISVLLNSLTWPFRHDLKAPPACAERDQKRSDNWITCGAHGAKSSNYWTSASSGGKSHESHYRHDLCFWIMCLYLSKFTWTHPPPYLPPEASAQNQTGNEVNG